MSNTITDPCIYLMVVYMCTVNSEPTMRESERERERERWSCVSFLSSESHDDALPLRGAAGGERCV